MTLTSFLVLLLVAGICGSIGRAIAGLQPRWLSRFNCFRVHWCPRWRLARRSSALAGFIRSRHRPRTLSHHLVDHRFGAVRGGHQLLHAPGLTERRA
jgi:hypothetical protein